MYNPVSVEQIVRSKVNERAAEQIKLARYIDASRPKQQSSFSKTLGNVLTFFRNHRFVKTIRIDDNPSLGNENC